MSLGLLFGPADPLWAQGVPQGAAPVGLRVTSLFDSGFNYVDSSYQTTPGVNEGKRGDLVTQLRSALQINGRMGRTRLDFYYALDAYLHSRRVAGFNNNSVQNALNASLSSELLERWLFLDATATITQQLVNPYSQVSADGTQYNSNRNEVAEVVLRPYARGVLGNVATYDLSLTTDAVRNRNALATNSHSNTLALTLNSMSQGALFGWGGSATAQRVEFTGGQASDNKRVTASLLVRPNPEVSGSLRIGRESTSVGSVYNDSYNNWGGDVRWTPSPRTSAGFSMDHRYFGRAHQANFEHRMSRFMVRYSSSRDVIVGGGARGLGLTATLFDLFYSRVPADNTDPAARAQEVRNMLIAAGYDPNQVVSIGFATGGATVQRRDDLSLSYVGLRFTFTLLAYRNDSSRIDQPAGVVDLGPVHQSGLAGTFSYRLSPTGTVSLSGSRADTQGTATQPGNRLNSVYLSWSERLGRLTTVSANARYSEFSGSINPYHESAIGASLGLRF